jgi:hypothetical protein
MDNTTTPPAYPITCANDPRFTIGLLMDVGAVLTRHGYPPLATPTDTARWSSALFAAIYRETP